jgi:hypothetical protein
VEAMVVLAHIIRAVVLLAVVSVEAAQATTYYTDKAGSNANSCATAATASSDRTKAKLTILSGKGCLTAAGDTLIVGDGTYVEGEIAMTVSGSSGNPITIRAENQNLAILSSTSSCEPNISFYASYITVDGLRSQVDATDVQCPGGRNSASDAFVRMWNSTTPHLGGPTTTGYQGGVVKNCTVDYSTHRGVGIKTNQDNSIIENCVIHQSAEGMGGLNQIIRNNTIDQADIYGDHITCKGGARNCQVYNNVVTKSTGDRALMLGGNSGNSFVWDTTTGIECYNCVAYNNVVNVTGGSTTWIFGMLGCQDCTLSNNVVIGGSTHLGQGGSAPDVQPYPVNPTIENNILYCNGVGAQNGSFTGTQTRDYNNYYNCTGTPAQTHAITGDPLFVNAASDWHLQNGSPALNAGTTITMIGYNSESIDVSLDYVGTTRQTPWDLGIYEDASTSGASTSGKEIMFISLAWFLFGLAVVAGGMLAANGLQILARGFPGAWLALSQWCARIHERISLRYAWKALMRVDKRNASKPMATKSVEALKERE